MRRFMVILSSCSSVFVSVSCLICVTEKLMAQSWEHGATGPSTVSPSIRKPRDKCWIPKGLQNICSPATQLFLVLCNGLKTYVQHLSFYYITTSLVSWLVLGSWPLKYLGLWQMKFTGDYGKQKFPHGVFSVCHCKLTWRKFCPQNCWSV